MIAVPNTGPSAVPVPPRSAISGGSRLRSTPSAIPGSMKPEFSAKSTPAAAVGRLATTRAAVLYFMRSRPMLPAAASSSLMQRKASPSRLRDRYALSPTETAARNRAR